MNDINDWSPQTWQITTKTLLERFIAALLLLFLFPLLFIIALMIKIQSPGPVIFRQSRHGLDNTVFQIFKFRSMQWSGADNSHAPQAQREDVRMTQIGKFLRRSSFDELPQLLNILQGDMSLVGPRPHPVALDETYEKLIDNYRSRYRVRPGITGWAQVNGHRGPINGVKEMKERLSYDNFYIEHWSLLMDLKILLMTLRYGFFHENAY